MIDYTVTIGNVITFLGIVGAGAWFIFRHQGHTQRNSERIDQIVLRITQNELRQQHTERELSEFKIKASETFATSAAIREVEERVVDAINRLGDRLDRFFDKARERE